MGRPVDWNEVFGFGDPTPGNVFEVRQVSRKWDDVADKADYAEGKLRGWLHDDAVATWIGKAGDAFATHSSDLPDQLAKTHKSYRLASEAMSWWAGRLDTHQNKADNALVQGRQAKQDIASAHAALSQASSQASSAGKAGALNYDGPADHAPTSQEVSDAQGKLNAANAAKSHAEGLVNDAEAELAAARKMALEAKGLRESDGRTTADKIHDAADAGIKPRSRWQKFKDGVAEAWSVLVEIAKIVVLVLGVVALIIGGPLAWVVFAAALIVLADTLMKYAKGQATLMDVLLAAVSCIPGTKGLTTLAALSSAFKAGGLIGATAHVLAAGKTLVVDMARSLKSLGAMKSWAKDTLSLGGEKLMAAKSLLSSAMRNEPGITTAMKNIVADLPGSELVGLEARLKGADSLFRKVATDLQGGDDILDVLGDTKDSVRFTMTSGLDDFASSSDAAVQKMVDQGFENLSFKNTFGQEGYQGINTSWRDPISGQTFEMQFHTPQSFDVKTQTHDMYDVIRNPDTPPGVRDDMIAQQNVLFDSVNTPPGSSGVHLPGGATHAPPDMPYHFLSGVEQTGFVVKNIGVGYTGAGVVGAR